MATATRDLDGGIAGILRARVAGRCYEDGVVGQRDDGSNGGILAESRDCALSAVYLRQYECVRVRRVDRARRGVVDARNARARRRQR